MEIENGAGPSVFVRHNGKWPTREAKVAKGYLIARIEVHDETAYREYALKVPATLVRYEGEFLVRGGRTEPLEGDGPLQRNVVLGFPSLANARDWYESEGYQALIPLRQAAAVTHSFLVEG